MMMRRRADPSRDRRFDNPLEKWRELAFFWATLFVVSNLGWTINVILWYNGYWGR